MQDEEVVNMVKKYSPWVGKKIEKIMKEGVRRNTRKPVSKKNPRRKVSQKQAIAISLSMARKRGMKVPKKNPWLA